MTHEVVDTMRTVQARELQLTFGATAALRGATLGVEAGEVLALMGPSGSGKSTLLHCLAGILVPDAGEVVVLGHDLVTMSERQRSDLRLSRMGFVLQSGDLIPELTLHENVALPLQLLGHSHAEAFDRAADLLEIVGLRSTAGRRTGSVSGGEAQRAAVARAVVHGPDLVFADEPTGALDTVTGELVLDLLLESTRARGASLLIVTHDHRVAAHADRLLVMRDGQMVGTDQP